MLFKCCISFSFLLRCLGLSIRCLPTWLNLEAECSDGDVRRGDGGDGGRLVQLHTQCNPLCHILGRVERGSRADVLVGVAHHLGDTEGDDVADCVFGDGDVKADIPRRREELRALCIRDDVIAPFLFERVNQLEDVRFGLLIILKNSLQGGDEERGGVLPHVWKGEEVEILFAAFRILGSSCSAAAIVCQAR